jgi:hypothetical protein
VMYNKTSVIILKDNTEQRDKNNEGIAILN